MKTLTRFLPVSALVGGAILLAQNPVPGAAGRGGVDPFARAEQEIPEENLPAQVSVCYEVFSLPMDDAAKLRRTVAEDAQLYEEVLTRVDKGTATRESYSIVVARSGEKAVVECISEYIYPTEFNLRSVAEKAAPPTEFTADGKRFNPTPKLSLTPETSGPALPTSFETRNQGHTLEIEPTIGGDGKIIDLRIAPEVVTLAERVKWGQGSSEAEMPNFETQRATTAVTMRSGIPIMIGTPNRPPNSKLDADAAKKVWFAFVTAKIVRVPR